MRGLYCFFSSLCTMTNIIMQGVDTLAAKAESAFLIRDTLHIHSHTNTATHSQPSISTSAPCKLSLIPGCRDLCQACVTVWGTEVTTPSAHSPVFICLFVGLCSFISRRLPSLCLSSTLRFSHDPLLSDLFSDLSPLTTLQ